MKNLLMMICLLSVTLVGRAQDLAMVDHKAAPAVPAPAGAVSAPAAPTFAFEVWGGIPDVENPLPEKHYLGGVVTKKWNTFLKNFSRQYTQSVGFTDNGYETLKPAVYNAVMRANRYVRKCLKHNLMGHDEAVNVMTHVLDCANTVVFEGDTGSFESAAAHASTGKEAVDFFESVKLIQR